MNSNEVRQPTVTTEQKPRTKATMTTLGGAAIGALIGALIGIMLSRGLGLGERLQQLNLTNTGSNPMLVKIDTTRWNGDGEVVIDAGKVGMFIYGEGDNLSIFPSSQAAGPSHSVTLERKPIRAEANADDKDSILFAYKSE